MCVQYLNKDVIFFQVYQICIFSIFKLSYFQTWNSANGILRLRNFVIRECQAKLPWLERVKSVIQVKVKVNFLVTKHVLILNSVSQP